MSQVAVWKTVFSKALVLTIERFSLSPYNGNY